MARIFPFRAWRYNLAQVSAQDVMTQPYDKITPAMQQACYLRSPYNLVRIILRQAELFDRDGDPYANAARDFHEWRRNGVLAQEPTPCMFAYSQRFSLPGAPEVIRERRGLIALGELSEYSRQVVFPHEQTLSRPKSDRLNLLRATRAHFGQIFMLYSDPARTVDQLLFGDGPQGGDPLPEIELTDDYGVLNRVWKVSDPAKINLLIASLADKKLIIADGHHRYETALSYRDERGYPATGEACERPPSGLPRPPFPEAAAMMTFVNMDSEGLTILPTHRVVFGLSGFETSAFLTDAARYFDVAEIPEHDPVPALARLSAVRRTTAFAAITRRGWYLLTARQAAVADAAKETSLRQGQLDVVQLHTIVLEKLLGLSAASIRQQTNLRYLRDAGEVAGQVERGEADIGFLMNPVTIDELREVAFAGEVLPPKSTDFYPKLLSGLAIYALD